MAPEQTGRMNGSIDSRSDFYAVGVTLYRMLTGSLPFRATMRSDGMGALPHCKTAGAAGRAVEGPVALAKYQRIWSWINGRSIESLIELPLMSDPPMLGTLDVLTEVVTPPLFTDENLLSLVISRMVNLSLDHRNSDGSCFTYAFLGMIAGPHFDDYEGVVPQPSGGATEKGLS